MNFDSKDEDEISLSLGTGLGVLFFVVLLILLTGCASMGQPDAASIVRDNKNASIVCSHIVGVWGTADLIVVNQEAGVIKDGGISVGSNCQIQTQSTTPPRVVVPPKEPTK